jgi:hypothetical protein
MSYDLYLKPRQGRLDSDSVETWIAGRPNYQGKLLQFMYVNELAGVYFVIDLRDRGENDEELHVVKSSEKAVGVQSDGPGTRRTGHEERESQPATASRARRCVARRKLRQPLPQPEIF